MLKNLCAFILIISTALAEAPAALCQSKPSKHEWSAVQAVPPGSNLTVKMKDGTTVKGRLGSASDTALTLLSDNQTIRLETKDIQKIHRVKGRTFARSTGIGLAIGAGYGAGMGGVIAIAYDGSESGEELLPVIFFATVGAIVGTITGFLFGFRRDRKLVYEAEYFRLIPSSTAL